MAILSNNQLAIVAILSKGAHYKSQLTATLSGTSSLIADLEAIQSAGIILNIDGDWVQLRDRELLLDKQSIYHRLNRHSRSIIKDLYLLPSVTSTNDEIKNYDSPCVLLAEQQEKGKGRYGRDWLSPFAAGIYLSLRLPFNTTKQDISGLSLAVGVSIAKLLDPIIKVGLKWPNDLLIVGGKLGGILIEVNERDLIIGVGINYNRQAGEAYLYQFQLPDRLGSRNLLAASLINGLLEATETFFDHGFAAFRDDWQQRDILVGQEIEVNNGKTIRGLYQGVDERGTLLIKTADGIQSIASGTLRI